VSAEAELAKLEARVVDAGEIGRWLRAVDTLRVLLAMGDEDIVRRLIMVMTAPQVEAKALAAVLDAFALGAEDALSILADAGIADIRRTGRPSKAALEVVKGVDKVGALALAQAVKLAGAGADISTVVAPVFGHANRVRGSVSDAINRGGNEGATAIADAAGLPTVWVAETDACVACLAYSGHVADPGDTFPGGLTYGRKAYYPDALESPPRHPRCRCTVEPLHSEEYAAALRREADRSVLRGFSLSSESMKTRVEAAHDLVEAGVDAPKSVIDYARRSVKRGAFTTRGRPPAS
jgi:hypothetical protein